MTSLQSLSLPLKKLRDHGQVDTSQSCGVILTSQGREALTRLSGIDCVMGF